MARISTYPTKPTPVGADRIIGTDSDDLSVKNFLVSDLIGMGGGGIDTSAVTGTIPLSQGPGVDTIGSILSQTGTNEIALTSSGIATSKYERTGTLANGDVIAQIDFVNNNFNYAQVQVSAGDDGDDEKAGIVDVNLAFEDQGADEHTFARWIRLNGVEQQVELDVGLTWGGNANARHANATPTSNVLHSYEEGTWVPASVTIGAPDFASATGEYVKIGKMVHVSFIITLPSSTSGRHVAIGAWPYTPDGSHGGGITGSYYLNTAVTEQFPSGWISANANEAGLLYGLNSSTSTGSAPLEFRDALGTVIIGGASYIDNT